MVVGTLGAAAAYIPLYLESREVVMKKYFSLFLKGMRWSIPFSVLFFYRGIYFLIKKIQL